MKPRIQSVPLVALVILLGAHPVSGQARTRVWLGLGFAQTATTSFGTGIGILTNVAVARSGRYAELRVSAMSDARTLGNHGSVGDVGLLYGLARRDVPPSASVAAGVGAAWRNACSSSSGGSGCYTPALLASAQMAIQWSFVGLALHGFGDLNVRGAFAGVAIQFQVGRM